MAKYFNITGELTRELLAAGSNTNASSISLANVDSSHTSIVDLYIEKAGVGKFYLLKNVNIPTGTTLVHDLKGFNNKTCWIEVNANGRKQRSPNTYGPTELWPKVMELYKFYYDKNISK